MSVHNRPRVRATYLLTSKRMRVLSLFDGISCGQVALQRVGVDVEAYYASEVDKHAIAITQKNHPSTVQLGDVTKWREWAIEWSSIDLVQGGSPCQGFSNAGKGLNFDDPRSRLFFVFVEILEHVRKHNPNVRFLLENVRMKKEWSDVITATLGVEPVTINSALVSAQNRVRMYWTNIGKIEQPADRGIVLRDVLDGIQCTDGIAIEQRGLRGRDSIRRIYSKDGKSPTLQTASGGNREPKIGVREKSKCVRSSGLGSYDRHEWDSVGDKDTRLYWRKLTPVECERLQTLPDGYTEYGLKCVDTSGLGYHDVYEIPKTKRYHALGNGWTVAVIEHIYAML